LIALASASVALMRQVAVVRTALDVEDARPPAGAAAPVRRTTEAMIAYQRGYQAALVDVARAAGCPCAAPGPPSHAAGRERGEAVSLAEFLERESLTLGICVGPGWDV
jgi:hypothetical protein